MQNVLDVPLHLVWMLAFLLQLPIVSEQSRRDHICFGSNKGFQLWPATRQCTHIQVVCMISDTQERFLYITLYIINYPNVNT